MKKMPSRGSHHQTPHDTDEQRRTLAKIELQVESFFANHEKSTTWFSTPNPMLGDARPIDMIRTGRSEKLLRFIESALGEANSKLNGAHA